MISRRGGVRSSELLGWVVFVREIRNLGVLMRVLDRNGGNVPVMVKIEQGVLIKVPGLGNFDGAKFNIQGIGVLKIFDLHGLNLRSKNALCTVSPSASSTPAN